MSGFLVELQPELLLQIQTNPTLESLFQALPAFSLGTFEIPLDRLVPHEVQREVSEDHVEELVERFTKVGPKPDIYPGMVVADDDLWPIASRRTKVKLMDEASVKQAIESGGIAPTAKILAAHHRCLAMRRFAKSTAEGDAAPVPTWTFTVLHHSFNHIFPQDVIELYLNHDNLPRKLQLAAKPLRSFLLCVRQVQKAYKSGSPDLTICALTEDTLSYPAKDAENVMRFPELLSPVEKAFSSQSPWVNMKDPADLGRLLRALLSFRVIYPVVCFFEDAARQTAALSGPDQLLAQSTFSSSVPQVRFKKVVEDGTEKAWRDLSRTNPSAFQTIPFERIKSHVFDDPSFVMGPRLLLPTSVLGTNGFVRLWLSQINAIISPLTLVYAGPILWSSVKNTWCGTSKDFPYNKTFEAMLKVAFTSCSSGNGGFADWNKKIFDEIFKNITPLASDYRAHILDYFYKSNQIKAGQPFLFECTARSPHSTFFTLVTTKLVPTSVAWCNLLKIVGLEPGQELPGSAILRTTFPDHPPSCLPLEPTAMVLSDKKKRDLLEELEQVRKEQAKLAASAIDPGNKEQAMIDAKEKWDQRAKKVAEIKVAEKLRELEESLAAQELVGVSEKNAADKKAANLTAMIQELDEMADHQMPPAGFPSNPVQSFSLLHTATIQATDETGDDAEHFAGFIDSSACANAGIDHQTAAHLLEALATVKPEVQDFLQGLSVQDIKMAFLNLYRVDFTETFLREASVDTEGEIQGAGRKRKGRGKDSVKVGASEGGPPPTKRQVIRKDSGQ